MFHCACHERDRPTQLRATLRICSGRHQHTAQCIFDLSSSDADRHNDWTCCVVGANGVVGGKLADSHARQGCASRDATHLSFQFGRLSRQTACNLHRNYIESPTGASRRNKPVERNLKDTAKMENVQGQHLPLPILHNSMLNTACRLGELPLRTTWPQPSRRPSPTDPRLRFEPHILVLHSLNLLLLQPSHLTLPTSPERSN